ncbi:MAG: SIS domain-containing protein [Cryomorphaceae bacterium]|nr:MAG: SIS domain-containing protein [Cryomorphaceae bacterium]
MLQDKIKQLIAREVAAIQNIPVDGSIAGVVDLIHKQVHERSGKVVISGIGKAGQIGINIATTLSSTGTPAIFLHPSEAQHGDLGVLQPNDVMLLISNSGKTREILELVQLTRNLYPEINIIALSGQQESPLAEHAHHLLYTGDPQEICPLGLTPTTSTTVMTVVGDILIVLLMEKIGFTREEYAKRHHSGYLGDKARQNTDFQ